MSFLKFSILFIFSSYALSFQGNACFESNYKVSVSHKSFPFGLLTKKLEIEKKDCRINIRFDRYKYLKTIWEIDICRDPVHIKEKTRTTEVIRKVNECTNVKSAFCNEYLSIKKVMENNGLIFASGDKSNLNSDHGKVYCSYLLINRYLDKNLVFNTGTNYDFISGTLNVTSENSGFVVDEQSGKADF